jgi:hypothetical protein
MKLKMFLLLLVAYFNAFSGMVYTWLLPGVDKLARLASTGGDAIVVLLAGLVVWKHRGSYPVRFLLLFLLTVIGTVIYNIDRVSVVSQLNGLRQPLFFFASLVVMYDLFQSAVSERLVRHFTIFLVLFAAAQIPTSIVQFLLYGPGDRVGGTFGIKGGSGYVTLLAFMISFYVTVRFASLEDGTHFKIGRALVFTSLLIPCALNETKVAFLLLPVYFAALIASRRHMMRAIPLLIVGVMLAYALDYYYSEYVEDTSKVFDIVTLEHYLFYGRSYYTDIPRFAKLGMMFTMMGREPITFLTGFGWGIFSGGDVMDASRFARSVAYFSGSRMMIFTIWLQGGVAALAISLGAAFWYLRSGPFALFTVRRFALFLAAILLAMIFYNEALIDRTFAVVLAFLSNWIGQQGVADFDTDLVELQPGTDEATTAH